MAKIPRRTRKDQKHSSESDSEDQDSTPQPAAPAFDYVVTADMANARLASPKTRRPGKLASRMTRKLAAPATDLPVVLFGYESSAFTLKVRLALRLKQVPYTFVPVPSMPPRHLLKNSFGLPYRRIPVLAIGRDVYVDTTLILEILEQRFNPPNFATLYPVTEEGRTNRTLIRLLTAYWADRPLFRVSTGLVPPRVWRSRFGTDRGQPIGHPLDAEKLASKIAENLAALDVHLNLVETQLKEAEEQMQTKPDQARGSWLLSSPTPSAADLALWYQLKWGSDISQGKGVNNLTGGAEEDGAAESEKVHIEIVFNSKRYPRVSAWFERFEVYVNALPKLEKVVEDPTSALRTIKESGMFSIDSSVLQAMAPQPDTLAESLGLNRGATVLITPNDTGREDPTNGVLVDFSAEEVVVQPCGIDGKEPEVEVRLHFPRIGFVFRPVKESKL